MHRRLTHLAGATILVAVCIGLAPAGEQNRRNSGVSNADDRARNVTLEDSRKLIETLKPLAGKMPSPEPGDWLYHHPEKGQSFADWRSSNPPVPTARRHTFYIQPIGPFSEAQDKIVTETAAFLGACYDLPVKVLDPIPMDRIPESARRTSRWGEKQVLSTYILEKILAPALGQDAACLLGLTATDLWPGKGWNFVFGQASLRDRVGVWSMNRYGRPDRSQEAFRTVLLRTIKTAAHEAGHMFGMGHCIAHPCLMNGSNSLEESDSRPLALCPQCAAKACWAGDVRPIDRYRKLAGFCASAGLEKQGRFYRRAAALLGKRQDRP
jgi:archaemetzincin